MVAGAQRQQAATLSLLTHLGALAGAAGPELGARPEPGRVHAAAQ